MGLKDRESLLERSLYSVSWNVVSNTIFILVSFLRSLLLARWLPVETFGVYGMAVAIVGITGTFADFGFGGAFLNRTEETEDEEKAAGTHFTLKLIFTSVWAIVLIFVAFYGFTGEKRLTLLVITMSTAGIHLTRTSSLILVRRVIHRRLALIRAINITVAAIIAVVLAMHGETIWALLSMNVSTFVISFGLHYLYRPVWHPKLRWSWNEVSYFIRFGVQNFFAGVLLKTIDNIDDMWTGIYLGDRALGFYTRAYSFATYPRKIVAAPVNMVAKGTYAELKFERERLSQAFFRINSLLIRTGFLFAGILVLIAPEFIRIFIGPKWLPMLNAFRLMMVFTMLDPIKNSVSDLFVGVGHPKRVVITRLVQLGALAIGLYTFGMHMGISGVALAADVMIFIGMGTLFYQAKSFVDFSLKKIFLYPMISLVVAMSVARSTLFIPGVLGDDWRTLIVKVSAFLPIYFVLLYLFEKESTIQVYRQIKNIVIAKSKSKQVVRG